MLGPLALRATTRAIDYDDIRNDPVSQSLAIEERRLTRLSRRMILVIVMGLIGFILWVSIAPIHQVVSAEGTLLPSEQLRRVEHLEGGIVQSVLVEPGARVLAGQPIVRLDGSQLRSERAQAAARLDAATLTIERLRSLVLRDFTALAREGALAEILASQQAAGSAAWAFEAAQIEAFRAERLAREAQTPTIQRRRETAERELEIVLAQLELNERSFEAGIIVRRLLIESQRDVLAMRREITQIEGMEAQTLADVAAIRAKEEELLSSIRKEALTEIAAREVERAELVAQIAQIDERISRLDIVSPVEGWVNRITVKGEQEIVAAGDAVAEVVPMKGALLAKVDVPADRIGRIKIGMPARVKVLTYDYTRFGAVDAIVESVSPGSIETEDGSQFFEVTLKLATPFVGPESRGLLTRTGMSIQADITLGWSTVGLYLLKPLRVIADRALTES